MSSEPAIVVKNLTKEFIIPHKKTNSLKQLFVNLGRKGKVDRRKVLNDISFEIKKGEFFGIVGRNGSGKSTLLKILAGVYTPTKGEIGIKGSLTPFIELGVGFNPELTGRENVFLNGALLGFTHKQMEKMYDDIVDFAELRDFMDQKLKNYSSGMQVRLAFSIAIRSRSDILLIDEVLAVGDANFQQKCFDYFHKLKADNRTVVLVSHDMNSVTKFCDRALLLEAGSIVKIGKPEEVSNEYVFRNIKTARTQNKNNESNKLKQSKAIITEVKLLNSKGGHIQNLALGCPFRLSIGYKSKPTEKELNIGVGLHSESNGYVFGYNTQMDGFKITRPEGIIELLIDTFPILDGKYFINVVCFGKDEVVPYDFKPKVLSFNIYKRFKNVSYRGVVNLDHKWRIKIGQ